MNNEPYIPAPTLEKLSHPIPFGERHKAKLDIAMNLLFFNLDEIRTGWYL